MDSDDAGAFKGRQRQLWSIGDYPAMGEQLAWAARDVVERLDIRPGMRVLDVGTGSGNAAILAARRGAEVVGLDLTPEQFDEADWRASEAGVQVEWREGDAEELPFAEASFDRVLSLFALLFAPRPEVAAGELVRVLRPGGRLGVCNWIGRGIVAAVIEAVGDGGLPPGGRLMPWGEPEHAGRLLRQAGLADVEFSEGAVEWMFPTAEDGVRWLEEVSGPIIAVRAALGSERWAGARRRLLDAVSGMTRADMDGIWVAVPYLVAVGTRPYSQPRRAR